MRFEWARGKGCLCSLRRASRFSVALILISIVAVCSAALPMANALTRVGALTLNTGENTLYSAVIDTANGYAYFGTETAPGIVVKVRLSDFTRVGALTLNLGENLLRSAVIDTANGYAYFGTITSPGIVVKVDLSTFTRVGALTLNTGEDYLKSAVIDTANGFAYFGTMTSPGIVVKVETNRRPAAPVGGVFTPVNKLAILAPYLALIGLLGAVTVAVVTKRRRKA